MSATAIDPLKRYPGFSSFKTLAPIYYPRRWMRTALIRATLDPEVIALAPLPNGFRFPPEVDFAFITRVGNGFRHILLTDYTERQLGLQGDPGILTLNRTEVMAKPSAEVLRQIWTCSRVKIDPSFQVNALTLLSDGEHRTIKYLVEKLGGTGEEVRQVLAMAASGLLELDTSVPLTIGTSVRVATHQTIPDRTRPDLECWSRLAIA